MIICEKYFTRFVDDLTSNLPLKKSIVNKKPMTYEPTYNEDQYYWLEKYRENEEYLSKRAEMTLETKKFRDKYY